MRRCNIFFFLMISPYVVTSDNFIASFSDPKHWTKEEWIEFTGDMPNLKEFTVCHWERRMFFPEHYTPVWSFCAALTNNAKDLKCTGGYSRGIYSTANRDIVFGGLFEGWTNTTVDMAVKIPSFRHRTWNHFCWSYSSQTGSSKVYYNGKFIKEVLFKDRYR